MGNSLIVISLPFIVLLGLCGSIFSLFPFLVEEPPIFEKPLFRFQCLPIYIFSLIIAIFTIQSYLRADLWADIIKVLGSMLGRLLLFAGSATLVFLGLLCFNLFGQLNGVNWFA